MAFRAEDADRGGIQRQVLALLNGQADPPHSEGPQELTVREQGDVPAQPAQPGQQPVRASGDLSHGFAAGAAVLEDVPPRAACADLRRRQALEVPVIPFMEVRLDACRGSEARELACPKGAPEGAHENVVDPRALQQRAQAGGAALSVLGERQVRAARVPPG